MKRRRRIMFALTLVLALAAAGAASLWIWNRWSSRAPAQETVAESEAFEEYELLPEPGSIPSTEPEPAPPSIPEQSPPSEPETLPSAEPDELPEASEDPEPYVPLETPSFVSLYSVDMINSRPRAMTAVSSRLIPSSRTMRFTMNMHRDLTYLNTQLGDLPLLEVYKDDGEQKPLLLFLHGLGNDKESLISVLSAFADAGYHAVGVDAFDQGERYTEDSSVDTWAAVLITVADIDPIIEYYQTVDAVDADSFVLGGFSMGAVESMAYVETGSYRPSAVIALCGMCQYSAWQRWRQDDLTYGWLSSWWGTVWTFPENQTFWYTGDKYETILSMDVTNNLDSFADIPILCCVGTSDYYFNARSVQSVVQQIRDSGNPNADCIVYPFVTHQITNRMLTDSLQFLDRVSA